MQARSRPLAAMSLSGGTSGAKVAQDLAELRRRWGEAYRVTWERRFRATHITSGQFIDADDAPELHERIREHYSEHASG